MFDFLRKSCGLRRMFWGMALWLGVQVCGAQTVPYMPAPFTGGWQEFELTGFTVAQTTDYSASFPAENAVDGDSNTFSHTDGDTPDNFWYADLGEETLVYRVELVNRNHANTASRMDNLMISILDENMDVVATDITSNPGAGGTYTFSPPEDTEGRFIIVGLPDGETNGRGDYAIVLAEVRIFSATELFPCGRGPRVSPMK